MTASNFRDDGRWPRAYNWAVGQKLGYHEAGEFASWAVRVPVDRQPSSMPEGYRQYRQSVLAKELADAIDQRDELNEKITRLQRELGKAMEGTA